MFIDWQDKLKRIGNRVALFDIPIAMHCHHYNINLHKMLEDILGLEGVRLMYNAAEESNHTAFKIMLGEPKKATSTLPSLLAVLRVPILGCLLKYLINASDMVPPF